MLKPVEKLAHTEYSLDYHPDYAQRLTGRPLSEPGALRRFYDLWGLDFIWWVEDGLHADWGKRGRCTEMGHAAYASDGSDKKSIQSCPFQEPEEVWAFDAVKEYGLPDFEEQVRAYDRAWRETSAAFPEQLVTGGYYKTMVSGAIQAFGWDMLLMGLADRGKMEKVLDSFYRFTKFHMEAWARTGAEAIIQHDDFTWMAGAFMHPDIYRQVIIPRYAELWKPLKAAGKKVLFCSDGNFMEFAADVIAAGADGLIFEPVNDFDWMTERFGQSACLIGSFVDCRDMTFGPWDKVETDMKRTFSAARGCKGVVFATGNHLPSNIPDDMMERYLHCFQEHRKR